MKDYFEISIGDKELITHQIKEEDIAKFVELTGDDNRLHVDEKFASNTQFKKPVVHGMLGASFISTVIGTKLPGDGALWFSQSLDFVLPARIGDILTISAEVIKKSDKERLLELKTIIKNQNNEIVTKGVAKVKMLETQKSNLKKVDTQIKIKTVLIFGGTGGIGRATCIQLAKDGYNIIIHYNKNKALAEEIKNSVKLIGANVKIVQGDILVEKDIQNIFFKSIRAFNQVDAIVNCASTKIPSIKFQELEWEDFTKQLNLNIKSVFMIVKSALPGLLINGYGKIINIGSFSSDKPNSDWAHYITSKSALVGLTKSLAFELAPKGIRVNMVTPSLIDTELTVNIPEKIKLLSASQTPLRRLASSQDVANVISFLVSEKSDFLAGENIRVNGGQFML